MRKKSINVFKGKKTYIGITLSALALLYPNLLTQTDAIQLNELLLGIAGIAISIYGRYNAGK